MYCIDTVQSGVVSTVSLVSRTRLCAGCSHEMEKSKVSLHGRYLLHIYTFMYFKDDSSGFRIEQNDLSNITFGG